ncbi:MAG: hypothetical protein GF398_13390 [Chitinivibrionales bacterium]|nr:hypothetical protein [Chitinivibrionales bacterium]
MTDNNRPCTIRLKFPGDIDYIPPIRKFIAETLQTVGFDSKFSYRSEIVIDEVCNNAVLFGCTAPESEIEFNFTILDDKVEFIVKDQGGTELNREKLKVAVERKKQDVEAEIKKQRKLGLEIVRMLSEELHFEIDENNLTSVKVVRRRDPIPAGK